MKKSTPKFFYNEKDASVGYLLTVGIFFAVSVIVMLVTVVYQAMLIMREQTETGNGFIFLQLFMSQSVFIMAFWMINLLTNSHKFKASGLNKGFNPLFIPVTAAIAMFLITFNMPILSSWEWLLVKINFNFDNISVLDIRALTGSAGGFVLTVLLVCVMPAVGEELIFRGIVFRGLAANGKKGRALVLSSVAFALMHMSPLQTIHQFFLGLAAAYLVLRTDSVYPAMLLHFFNNFIFVLYEYFGLGIIGTDNLIVIFGGGLILALIGIILISAVIDLTAGTLDKNIVAAMVNRGKKRRGGYSGGYYKSAKWLDGKPAVRERDRFWLDVPQFREGVDDRETFEKISAKRSDLQVRGHKKTAKTMFIAAVCICTLFWLINFGLGFVSLNPAM